MSYQSLTIVGNLTDDPELRQTGQGTPVCNFTVAVDGAKKEDPATFFRVTAWRKQAEVAAEWLRKGRQVLVAGTVSTHAYMSKKGDPGASLEVNAQSIKFLGGNSGGDEDEQPRSNGYRKRTPAPANNRRQASKPAPDLDADISFMDDDEIPFD